MRSSRPNSPLNRTPAEAKPDVRQVQQQALGGQRPPTPRSHQDSPRSGRGGDSYRRQATGGGYSYQHYQHSPRGGSDSFRNSADSSSNTPDQKNSGGGGDATGDSKTLEMKKSASRCRLFVGNIPQDMTDSELREMCAKYGKVGEVFVNSQRGFAFVRFDRRSTAEEAKDEIDGTSLRGKTLRVRYASHGAAVRVRNLSEYVSNELLYEAFSYFGRVERAVVAVDDRGKSTGEGIVEFDRKPVAQQCIAKCSEGCFLLTSELKPVVVESLVQVDEEDGLAERTLVKSDPYYKARSQPPRFVQPGSFEHSICARWLELEDQRRQLEAQLKERMLLAREQLELEIEQAMIDHQTYLMREDLVRRQNELRFMEEKRRQDLEKRKSMIQMVMQQQQQQTVQQQQQQFNFPRMPNFSMPSMPQQRPRLGPPAMENMAATPYPLLAHYLNNPAAAGGGQNSPSSGASAMQPSTSGGISSNGQQQGNLMAAAASSLSALNNAAAARVVPPGLFTTSAFFQNDPSVNPPLPKECLLPNKEPQPPQPPPPQQPPLQGRGEQQPPSSSNTMDNRSSYASQRKRSRF